MHTLNQVFARTRGKTTVLVFVNKQDDEIVDTIKRTCDTKDFYVMPITIHDAGQDLLDTYMVTGVPHCVFMRPNKWSYIMPHVTQHNLADMVAYIKTKN